MKNYKTLGAVFSAAVLFPLVCPAAGMTSHTWMTEEALANVKVPELKSLLERHRDVVLSNSGYPDFGNAAETLPWYKDKKIAIGESHSAAFIEAYLAYLKSEYKPPYADAEKVVAHFMGLAAHQLEDQTYDELFMRKAFLEDLETDDLWAYDLDTGADMMLVMGHGRYFKAPSYYVPAEDDIEVFRSMGLEVTKRQLKAGSFMHKAGHAGERLVAPWVVRKYRRECPWTEANVVDHPGGIEYHGPLVAAYWESLWAVLTDAPAHYRQVLSTYPEEGGELPADAYITVVFTRGVVPESFGPGAFELRDEAGDFVPGDLRFVGDNVVSYLPEPVLTPGKKYNYTLSTSVSDINGEHLKKDFTGSIVATEPDGFWRLHQPSPKGYKVIRF